MFDFASQTAAAIRSQVEETVARAEELAAGVAVTTERTFEAVMAPLDEIIGMVRDTGHRTDFLRRVHPDPEVREAALEAAEILQRWWQYPESPWSIELAFRPEIYRAVEEYASGAEAQALDGERRRFLEVLRADLALVGHHLDPDDQQLLREMSDRLIELQTAFERNIAEDDTVMLIGDDDLDGLPPSYVERLEREDGRYRVTMAYPDYVPFMENSSRRDLRQRLRHLYANRAVEANRPLLEEAVAMRHRMARLLGFDSWADRVLSTRMARTRDRVDAMYHDLIPALTAKAGDELEKVAGMLEEDTGDGQVRVFDWSYYDTQMRKRDFGIDPIEVSAYFPMPLVLEGMFDLTTEVFGITYSPATAPTWHPDVSVHRVTDTATGDLIGHFYLDLFPRQGKYTHAAVFSGTAGRRLPDGSYQAPTAAMVTNFTKPTKDTPSLLLHDEVVTLFHEFGHILHDLFAHCDLARFSGANTEWDFVEAPSQIMEHWVWQPAVLRRFARHHQTNEPIPDEMVEGLVAARRLNQGMWYLRQAHFGVFDQGIHGPGEHKDLDEILRRSTALSLLPHEEDSFFPASFGHLMGGYDAAYYGYLWSEVFGDDMFSRFEEEGVTNPEVGMAYRRQVLEKGGSEEAEVMLRAFLGREPNQSAFLRKIGIDA